MTREEQIREAAKKTTGLFSYRNGYSTAEDAFIAGAEWADANPCTPDMVVKIPERSREEIKELLANWKGTIVVGDDISLSPWISVEDRLPDDGVLVIVAYRWVLGEILYASDVFHIDYGWEDYDDIVAWMPIPQLPKGE